jgi:hypothetical protein
MALNKNGWIFLGILAAFAMASYIVSRSNADCKRFEMREVDMVHNGKFGGGVRTHKYKVCVDQPSKSVQP